MESKANHLNEQEFTGGCPMAKIDSISNKILHFLRQKLKKKYGDKKPSRIFHKKTIGVAKGELLVEKNLPAFLRQGLFREEKSYEVWVRFTNGNPNDNPDIKKTARGMAIKILKLDDFEILDKDPEGNTQDIILFNNPTFVPGICELQLSGVKAATAENLIKAFFAAIPILLRQFRAGIAFLNSASIQTPNVLEEIYYSATPYSFGKGKAIKWQVLPLKMITNVLPNNPSPNYLRERLKRDLSNPEEEVAFALRVQFCENPETEPIDDSTVLWETEFHTVATIILPHQIIDTKDRKRKSSELSFCPGHAIIEHAPLGGVNAVRRRVYKVLANERIAHLKKKSPAESEQHNR